MFVRVNSCATEGIRSYGISVEVDVSFGLPYFATVGLPDTAVKESKDRIRAAMKNSGYPFPQTHITVNLAPADVKKEGSSFDLPVALALLAAQGIIPPAALTDFCIVGELSLDGSVKGICGALSCAFFSREASLSGIILPAVNALEAAMVEGIRVVGVASLADVVEFLHGTKEIPPTVFDAQAYFSEHQNHSLDFSEIKGQEGVKRAMEVAAAGNHNVLMIGPPGSGKSMIAQRLPSILPDISFDEAIEITKIYSSAGMLGEGQHIIATRPFRAPHHTTSDAGLIGGGQYPRPGEISLAHRGVLFLDEMPEFKRSVLETLRQPLEEGQITITRSAFSATYPADFMLVSAMNPCPCGFYGDRLRQCRCSWKQIQSYQSRISGPLLDRIDIHIEVPSMRYSLLAQSADGEKSSTIKERVNNARQIQHRRIGSSTANNANMTDRQVREFCHLDAQSQGLMEMAFSRLGLSARASASILRVSRTIADLEDSPNIQPHHISEAIQYRSLDRKIV
ncbi:MAG: YifB family Mg chelatase-like AAA ATPase [Deltaproteobacteria bacterium]|nr:YifB family Mg chelatase-like AAA ATPase [Deltaproteobacteria bacterium]